jgi:hypothetical protein
MSRRRLAPAVVVIFAAMLASTAGLLACGTGDDTASKAPVIDAGAQDATTAVRNVCVPDGGASARCNSCATPATDPLNTCSPFVGACIPFDAARVPSHPML